MDLRGALRRFFCATTAPLNLALFRIVVFWLLTGFAETASWFGSLPRVLLFPPPGWHPLVPLLPGPDAATAIGLVFAIASWCALIGLFTRVSTAVAAILSIYVLGLPQLFGKIDHYHHIVWFALLLACFPSGETLSVDALVRRLTKSGAPAESVSAFPLRAAQILIGLIYFFPGFWKLWNVAGDWILGDAVRLHLYDVWSMRGSSFRPLFRLDEHPLLYRGVGLFTILFELSFLFLILNRRTRVVALVAGVGFHLGIWSVMGINFYPLVICYVAFLDLGRRAAMTPIACPGLASRTVGAVLIVAVFLCGVLRIDTWPVAVYPLFDYRVAPRRTTLTLELYDAAGRRLPFDPAPVVARLGNGRWMHLIGRIAAERSARVRVARAVALLAVLQANGVRVEQARIIRMYRDVLATPPHLQRFNPIRRQLIGELRAAPR